MVSVAVSAEEAEARRRREGVVGGVLTEASGSGGREIEGTSSTTSGGSWFLRSKGNFQDVDLDLARGAGGVENRAEFAALGGSTRLVVSLRGECSLDAVISNRLHVRFREVEIALGSLRPLRASLDAFEPRGWIDTAFVDDDLRVGRGDKGSIFVAARRR